MRFLLVVLAVAGCGTEESCPEPAASIERGLVGYTFSGNLEAACNCYRPRGGMTVSAYVSGGPISATSAEDGFYELELPPGRFQVCIGGDINCEDVTITDGVLRLDFGAAPVAYRRICD